MDTEKLLEQLRKIIELVKAGDLTSMEMISAWLFVIHWAIEWVRLQSLPRPPLFSSSQVDQDVLEAMTELHQIMEPEEARLKAENVYAGPAANLVIKMFLKAAIRKLLDMYGDQLPEWIVDAIKQLLEMIEKV